MRGLLLGLIGCAALGLFAASSGCGDTVTSGGSGGGGAASGTSGTAGGGTATCAQACDKLAQAGCGQPSGCTADCEEAYDDSPACKTQFDELLGCLVENASGSSGCKPAACDQAEDDLDACQDASGCDMSSCSVASDGSCDCEDFCNNQLIRATCQPNPDMTAACTCFSGGAEVGTCTSQSPMSACDLTAGCCASYFGGGGP